MYWLCVLRYNVSRLHYQGRKVSEVEWRIDDILSWNTKPNNIDDVEEVMPVELSRNITEKSIKHITAHAILTLALTA